MAITAFQSIKIGSIEIRLHTNISIFPSVNILCDEYLDGLSKAEIGQILLHSCIYAINGNGAIYCGLLFLKCIGNVGEGSIFFFILPSLYQRSLKFPISLTNLERQFWFSPFLPPSRADSELFADIKYRKERFLC